jgi:ComF family protein
MLLRKKIVRGFTSCLRRCESAFVGLDRRPAEEVISKAEWHPDLVEMYCSRCGSSLSWSCRTCPCVPGAFANTHGALVRLSSYEEPMSGWIKEMKYRSWQSMAQVLGKMLGEAIRTSHVLGGAEKPVLVPVPMPYARRFRRGMDHADLLCSGVSKTTGFEVFQPLKQKNCDVQSGATLSQRSRKRDPFMVSIQGRFWGKYLEGRSVIVIDDVRTTGRTIGLVARALKGCGASVVGAGVLAVTDAKHPQCDSETSMRSRHVQDVCEGNNWGKAANHRNCLKADQSFRKETVGSVVVKKERLERTGVAENNEPDSIQRHILQ